MAIDEVVFSRLRDAFTNEWKKVEHYVERRPLTKNQDKIQEYRTKITGTFNNICSYLITVYNSGDIETKLECIARINPYLAKTKIAFDTLRLSYDWPKDELTLIDSNLVKSVHEVHEPQRSTSTANQSDIASSTAHSDHFVDAHDTGESRLDEIIHELSNIQTSETEQDENTTIENQLIQQGEQHTEHNNSGDASDGSNPSSHNNSNLNSRSGSRENIDTMPQSIGEFYKMAGGILNYRYEGDAVLRDSFIEDCELVLEMAETANKAAALKLIKTKIIGRAREKLPDEINTFGDIKKALKEKIKADSSTVVEGRLTALRVYKGNFVKFSEEAEKLADAFRRSLISEGFAQSKADELTIRKTKEVCRRVARSDVVEGIIASTKCETPAEVIATLITETDTVRKKKHENDSRQKFSKNKNGEKKQFNKNKNYNKNNEKGNRHYNKNKNNSGHGGKGRGNKNDHVLRIVSDTNAPSTSAENSANEGEQVFRLNRS